MNTNLEESPIVNLFSILAFYLYTHTYTDVCAFLNYF